MQTGERRDLKEVSAPVLFFDGDCVLCNGFADFVLRWDRRRAMRLATLQGVTAASLLPRALQQETPADPEAAARPFLTSLVVWDEGAVHRKSDAALRVLSGLGGPWRLAAAVFRIVPRPLRDAVYDLVARNRYAWFGRRATCRLPTDAERDRFLP